MPVYQANSVDPILLEDGRARVRFRSNDNSSISVTIPESALHDLAERIAGAMAPPAGRSRPGRDARETDDS